MPQASVVPTIVLPDTAVLVLHGRPVAIFRGRLGASTPQDRAAAARQRYAAATAESVPAAAVTRADPAGALVLADNHPLFLLTAADLDSLAGQSLAQAVQLAGTRVDEALALDRESRSIPLLLRATGLVVLATIAFFVVLRLLVAGRRALNRALDRRRAAVPDVAVAGVSLLRPEQVTAGAKRVVGMVAWLVGLTFSYLWLTFALTRFAYSRPWGEALGGYLRGTLAHLLLGALSAVPGLFTVVIIGVVTRWLSRLVGSFFDAVESGSVDVPWVHPETASPTRRIATTLLWLFAIVVAYPFLPGSGSDVFKGVSVFAGLVLSLGSSGVVSQMMSGFVLTFSRALRPGDYVRVGDTEGIVMELGVLSTKIRTSKREEVTVPNSVVVGTTIKNFSRAAEDGLPVMASAVVTIGYDTPWRQVQGLLLTAAHGTPGLLTTPPPVVLQTALSDFYIEYQLNIALMNPVERPAVLSALYGNIADAFNEFGVQITSPHYVADPPVAQVVAPSEWFRAPAPPAVKA